MVYRRFDLVTISMYKIDVLKNCWEDFQMSDLSDVWCKLMIILPANFIVCDTHSYFALNSRLKPKTKTKQTNLTLVFSAFFLSFFFKEKFFLLYAHNNNIQKRQAWHFPRLVVVSSLIRGENYRLCPTNVVNCSVQRSLWLYGKAHFFPV